MKRGGNFDVSEPHLDGGVVKQCSEAAKTFGATESTGCRPTSGKFPSAGAITTKDLYAPKAPAKWNKNPNEWLSNSDIDNVLKQYESFYPEFLYLTTTPIDFDEKIDNGECVDRALCEFDFHKQLQNGKTKFGAVFNLDKHDESGSHWISLYMELVRERPFIFCFDSAGGGTPEEVKEFIERVVEQVKKEYGNAVDVKVYSNGDHDPQKGNNECGMYSIYFVSTMLTRVGRNMETEEMERKSLEEWIEHFKKGKIPDRAMNGLRDDYFHMEKRIPAKKGKRVKGTKKKRRYGKNGKKDKKLRYTRGRRDRMLGGNVWDWLQNNKKNINVDVQGNIFQTSFNGKPEFHVMPTFRYYYKNAAGEEKDAENPYEQMNNVDLFLMNLQTPIRVKRHEFKEMYKYNDLPTI